MAKTKTTHPSDVGISDLPLTQLLEGKPKQRAELAAAAAWEVTTLCKELKAHAEMLYGEKTSPQPHHSAIVIKLLASRAHDLAEAAALCLDEDEENQPLADLEKTVTHG